MASQASQASIAPQAESKQPLLSVQDLKIRIQMDNGEMKAVDGVDFEIKKEKRSVLWANPAVAKA